MKKIVAILVFIFAFTLTATAQDNKALMTKTETETGEVQKFLDLDDTTRNNIFEVILYKNKNLNNPSVDKTKLTSEIADKFRELLSKEEYVRLLSNTELYKKIIG